MDAPLVQPLQRRQAPPGVGGPPLSECPAGLDSGDVDIVRGRNAGPATVAYHL